MFRPNSRFSFWFEHRYTSGLKKWKGFAREETKEDKQTSYFHIFPIDQTPFSFLFFKGGGWTLLYFQLQKVEGFARRRSVHGASQVHSCDADLPPSPTIKAHWRPRLALPPRPDWRAASLIPVSALWRLARVDIRGENDIASECWLFVVFVVYKRPGRRRRIILYT